MGNGPKVVMTDDSAKKEPSENVTLINSTSMFFISPKKMDLVVGGKNKIQQNDQSDLIGLIKKDVFASTEQVFQ